MRRLGLAVSVLALCAGCATTAPKKYVKTFEPIPAGKSGELTSEETVVVEQLRRIGEHPVAVEYFGKMFQSAALVLWHFQDLTLTAQLQDGKYVVSQGLKVEKPDYVLPLANDHVAAMEKILADGTIDDQEAYQLHYVTFVPGLRAIFRFDGLYDPYVAERMALPPILHMSLKNPNNYVFPLTTRPIWATAVNVEGQWLVFEGKLGEAQQTIEVTREQAAEFSALLSGTKPEDVNTREKLDAYVDRVKGFLDSVTTQKN